MQNWLNTSPLARWVHLDSWGTGDWQFGFGWWDGAAEFYAGPWILRCSAYEAEYR